MNNLVIITHKSTGEQKTYTGDYGLKCNGDMFVVQSGPFKASVFAGRRAEFFVDIESLDGDGDDF